MTMTTAKIVEKHKTTFYDVKAEVFLQEIISKYNFDIEDITILNKGTFKRGYRKDILQIRETSNNQLEVFLSRNGVYDRLPNGIFHQDIKQDTEKSFNQLRKQGKEEERDARKLFAPLENEFFIQKLSVQKNEESLKRNLANSEKSFLFDLWGIKKLVHKKFIFAFSQLLPLAQKISRNKELIAKSLEEILQNRVVIREEWKPFCGVESTQNSGESFVLGISSTLELENNQYLLPSYFVTIKLKDAEEYQAYLPGGECYDLISVFWEYFVPLEIDLILNIVTEKDNYFTLNNTANAVLGLATTI